ncbi:MAG: hypothetical protein KDD61_18185 [Bdellovibrionales bacterium]|nr:hypothetical protein [Bdellovibrionales bacterium]
MKNWILFLFLTVMPSKVMAYQFYSTEVKVTLKYTDIMADINEPTIEWNLKIKFSKDGNACLIVSKQGNEPCPFEVVHERAASYTVLTSDQLSQLLQKYADVSSPMAQRSLAIIEHGLSSRGEKSNILIALTLWDERALFYDGTTIQFHLKTHPYESVHLYQNISPYKKIN